MQHDEAHDEKPFNPLTKQILLFSSLQPVSIGGDYETHEKSHLILRQSKSHFPIIVPIVTRLLIRRVRRQQILEVLKRSNILSSIGRFFHFFENRNQQSFIVYYYEQHAPPLKLGTSFTIKPCYVSALVLLLKLSNVSIARLRYGPELQRPLFKAGKIIPLPTRVFQLFPRCIQAVRVKGL